MLLIGKYLKWKTRLKILIVVDDEDCGCRIVAGLLVTSIDEGMEILIILSLSAEAACVNIWMSGLEVAASIFSIELSENISVFSGKFRINQNCNL